MPKYFQESPKKTLFSKDLSRLDSPNVGSNTERLDWLEGLELGHSSADYRALKYTPTTQQGYCTLIPYYYSNIQEDTHNKTKKQKKALETKFPAAHLLNSTQEKETIESCCLIVRCVFLWRYIFTFWGFRWISESVPLYLVDEKKKKRKFDRNDFSLSFFKRK